MADRLKSIYGIGVDPSLTASGIALVRYHPVGGPTVLWTDTVRKLSTRGLVKIAESIVRLEDYMTANAIHLYDLAAITIEDSFDGPFAGAGADVARAGGLWAGMLYGPFRVLPTFLLATQWRKLIFGNAHMGRVNGKQTCSRWVATLPGYKAEGRDISIDAKEAVGIAAAGCRLYIEKEGGE